MPTAIDAANEVLLQKVKSVVAFLFGVSTKTALGFAGVPGLGTPGAVMMRGFGDEGFAGCVLSELPGVIGRMIGRAGVDGGGVSVGSSCVCATAMPATANNAAPATSEMRRNTLTDTSNP
jgi:hypothetical protein